MGSTQRHMRRVATPTEAFAADLRRKLLIAAKSEDAARRSAAPSTPMKRCRSQCADSQTAASGNLSRLWKDAGTQYAKRSERLPREASSSHDDDPITVCPRPIPDHGSATTIRRAAVLPPVRESQPFSSQSADADMRRSTACLWFQLRFRHCATVLLHKEGSQSQIGEVRVSKPKSHEETNGSLIPARGPPLHQAQTKLKTTARYMYM